MVRKGPFESGEVSPTFFDHVQFQETPHHSTKEKNPSTHSEVCKLALPSHIPEMGFDMLLVNSNGCMAVSQSTVYVAIPAGEQSA